MYFTKENLINSEVIWGANIVKNGNNAYMCGTHGCDEGSCNNCIHFMLWGTSLGHCIIKNEDFLAWESCNSFIHMSNLDIFQIASECEICKNKRCKKQHGGAI